MNHQDVVAVTSRSFSNNDFLVHELKKLYSDNSGLVRSE